MKIMKGFARIRKEWCGSSVVNAADFRPFKDSKDHKPATLIMSDEPVFTATQMKALLQDVNKLKKQFVDLVCAGSSESHVELDAVNEIFAKCGIIFDSV